MAEINKAILTRLYSSLNTFYFIDFMEQNREKDYIELLLVKFL